MANAVNLPGDRLAGLDIDLKQKLRSGVRTLDELALFLQGKNPFGLANWFISRNGLYVHPSVATRVLPFAKDDDTSTIARCSHVDLSRDMYDSEIIAENMGGMEEAKKHAFTLNQVKAFIAGQWNGEAGQLLTNGYANIFYVIGEHGKLFALYVHWLGDEWRVVVWELGEFGRWHAGYRVFRNKP